jgi:hypothetical protein
MDRDNFTFKGTRSGNNLVTAALKEVLKGLVNLTRRDGLHVKTKRKSNNKEHKYRCPLVSKLGPKDGPVRSKCRRIF